MSIDRKDLAVFERAFAKDSEHVLDPSYQSSLERGRERFNQMVFDKKSILKKIALFAGVGAFAGVLGVVGMMAFDGVSREALEVTRVNFPQSSLCLYPSSIGPQPCR